MASLEEAQQLSAGIPVPGSGQPGGNTSSAPPLPMPGWHCSL